jgi:tetratricopeptide (TPR) repeat protein
VRTVGAPGSAPSRGGRSSDEARELDRLLRFSTRSGRRFGLALAIVRDPVVGRELRAQLAAQVEAAGHAVARLMLKHDDGSEDLVQRMTDAGQGADVLLVAGLERLLIDAAGKTRETPAVADLNQRRDALPTLLDMRVVVWITRDAYRSFVAQAWDLRQIMLTVAEFERVAKVVAEPGHAAALPGWFQLGERAEPSILAQAKDLAQAADEADDASSFADAATSGVRACIAAARFDEAIERMEQAAEVLEEQGALLEASGMWRLCSAANLHRNQLAQAQLASKRALELARRGGGELEQAMALSSIADIHDLRDELDEALRIHLEHELPVYERAGEVRRFAVTLAKVADLRRQLGQLDAAVELLDGQALPELERVGTPCELAYGRGVLARALVERGHRADLARAEQLLEQLIPDATRVGLPQVEELRALLERVRARLAE